MGHDLKASILKVGSEWMVNTIYKQIVKPCIQGPVLFSVQNLSIFFQCKAEGGLYFLAHLFF